MNLDAYLARIGSSGGHIADLGALRALHRAHATTIPFENLDVQLGRPIELTLPALERKLVRDGRGGYCFEHNSLFLAALRDIGFRVMPCEARVFDPGEGVAPRTHMLLVVSLDEGEWLCDVGFGGGTPLEPVPITGTVVEQGGTGYRVVPYPPGLILQAEEGAGWCNQYLFEKSPREAVDFQVANWYTSTHPASRFVNRLTAQLRTPDGWKVLRNLTWTRRSASGIETRQVGRMELEELLAREFGIRVPEGARFRALDGEVEPAGQA